ncbi:coronatine-insensitive protein 1 [Tanacetum coccineum]
MAAGAFTTTQLTPSVKGYPKALMFSFELFHWGGYVTPWVKEIVNNLKWLECVKFKRMIVHDTDLEVLAEGCGEKLKVLKIEACSGFSTDGLLHIGRKCSGLRTLCLQTSFIKENGGEWLHELALRNNYVVNLEDFGGDPYIDEGEEYIDVKFPPKSDTIKIESSGQEGLVSHIALTALAKGCLELEYLHINVKDITNETLECIGANLKNVGDLFLGLLHKVEEVSEVPLDNGVRALLTGCTKLLKLGIHLRSGMRGLTDVGWGYIGKYGLNLIYMNLGFCRDSDAGLLELSKWCLKLQKLEIRGCAFSQQALATFVLNVTSLRYLWVHDYQAFKNGHEIFAMVRPFWKIELIKYESSVAAQQQPPSLLAYYSVDEQRKDNPDSVIPLYPYVEFD